MESDSWSVGSKGMASESQWLSKHPSFLKQNGESIAESVRGGITGSVQAQQGRWEVAVSQVFQRGSWMCAGCQGDGCRQRRGPSGVS